MATVLNEQGSVVAVSHDMIMVRYNGKGVLFKKDMMNRTYKHDDIVQFSAKRATTVDIEVGDKLSQMANYEIGWLGTDIKYIKPGRLIMAEGVVINIPDEKAQFMFVDWKYTKNPPGLPKIPGYNKPLNTNVFITKATVRPEIEKLSEMFKPGQRVKYVAREQAPNERGVCWRAAIATDEYHDIVVDTTYQGRQTYRAVPKTGVTRPAPQPVKTQAKPTPTPTAIVNNPHSGQRPLVKPIPKPAETPKPASSSVLTSAPASTIPSTSSPTRTSFDVGKPPPTNGFDYFDTTEEACNARFNAFAAKYRKENPTCIFSQKCFEGCLKVKYLNTITEQLSAIKVAQN
ncbi:hypothetical protein L5515_004512 [Caenorhabditis briggsae]|uniref:Uncharacterized protein n=1 Tax=Caenorhabditis briggsae TaxID=6238 RepID=A0AAE9JCZ5_CAEBR|nr:hypothetical protein L5515_004512 [Caenorhabditis briggsae]